MGSRLGGVALESTLSQGLAGPRGNPSRVNRVQKASEIQETKEAVIQPHLGIEEAKQW